MTHQPAKSATRSTGPLLTIPEVADRLRVQRNTVYRLISTGHLRSVNVAASGRPRARVREDDLAKFIESRTAVAPDDGVAAALAATN